MSKMDREGWTREGSGEREQIGRCRQHRQQTRLGGDQEGTRPGTPCICWQPLSQEHIWMLSDRDPGAQRQMEKGGPAHQAQGLLNQTVSSAEPQPFWPPALFRWHLAEFSSLCDMLGMEAGLSLGPTKARRSSPATATHRGTKGQP